MKRTSLKRSRTHDPRPPIHASRPHLRLAHGWAAARNRPRRGSELAQGYHMPVTRYPSMRDRILANVRHVPCKSWGIETPCWEWQCSRNGRGYGHITIRNGKPWPSKVLVHRLVLWVFRGIPLADVEVAMHSCSNKLCCNPEHINAGSAEQNRDYYYDVERFGSGGGSLAGRIG